MAWFDDFFDEDYLRLFGPYVEGERATAESAGVLRLLDLPPGARILDLCCGQARHAAPLRAAGFEVVGLDLSATLLAAARSRDNRLPLVRADMRALPLADCSLDAVVNLFNAFGYFADEDDNAQVLREVARVLRPGGRFVQEVHHRDALMRGWEQETTHPPYDDGLVLRETRDWDAVRGRHTVRYLLTPPNGPAREGAPHTLRVYTLTELAALHDEAGLGLQDVHGDLSGGPLTIDSSLATLVSVRR